MKYGIISRTLDPDLETAFAMGRELGFDGLEILFVELEYQKEILWTREGVRQLRRLAEATGLELPSCCAGRYNRRGFVNPDPAVREECVEIMLRGFVNPDPAVREECVEIMLHLIDTCSDAGMENILVAFFGDHEIRTEQHKDLVVEALKRCAPKAESRGITLALEGTVPVEDFLAIIERVDSEALGIYYDVGNAQWLGYDIAAELRTARDLVAQVHIKDRTMSGENVPLGEGAVDFRVVADTLHGIGYEDYLVLETPGGDDRRAFAERHLAFIRQFVEG